MGLACCPLIKRTPNASEPSTIHSCRECNWLAVLRKPEFCRSQDTVASTDPKLCLGMLSAPSALRIQFRFWDQVLLLKNLIK